MASESSDPGAPLPEDLSSWLDDRAGEVGVERDELLRQLVAAYRVQTEDEPGVPPHPDVAALEDDLEEKLDDVRRRVVQVKQEADAKAPADHGHTEFERLADLAEESERLAAELSALADETDDVDGRVDDVAADLADLREKLTRVARAVVGLQRSGPDEALSRIRQTAAREGFERADCAACGARVSLALLGAARCPHCDVDLRDVEPTPGWFGKPRLVGEDVDG